MNFKELIEDFFETTQKAGIEIYNEISLQLELGLFLRNKLKDYKIQFERNVSLSVSLIL